SGQGQRADRLIKHPWELEARWRGSNGAHASSAEQAMPRESTLARGGQTRRARATGWLARFINAGPGRSRRAALTHPWQGRHRPRSWLAGTWPCCWGGLGTKGELFSTPTSVTAVVDLHYHTGGSFTHVHLASS